MNKNINWYLLDAKDKILGRLITKIVYLLLGKNKFNYLPYKISYNYVILINIKKIIVTGKKKEKKNYYRHSGYVGNLKTISFENMMYKNPKYIILHALKGMLPKNYIGRCCIKRLKIYYNSFHLHNSQKPVLVNF